MRLWIILISVAFYRLIPFNLACTILVIVHKFAILSFVAWMQLGNSAMQNLIAFIVIEL